MIVWRCSSSPARTPWPAATGACGCGVLGRQLQKWGHREVDKLTTIWMKRSVASRRAPKQVIDGGRDYREREDARVR